MVKETLEDANRPWSELQEEVIKEVIILGFFKVAFIVGAILLILIVVSG